MPLLCIDGGGTKTAAVVLGDDGGVLGVGMGGPLAFVREGGEVVGRSAAEAVGAAVREAGVEGVDRAVVILGGGNTSEAQAAVRAASGCESLQMTGEPQAAAALARALGFDIVVIAGTGVIAVGLDGERLLLSSGLGVLLGDEGSAFWVGWEGVRAVLRALDGRGQKTRLTRVVPPGLGISDVADATQGSHRADLAGYLRIAALEATRLRIAALAPLVSSAAMEGDLVAFGIMKRAGEELALNGIALARRMGKAADAVGVVGLGSMFRAGLALTESFEARLAGELPRCRIALPELDLIAGAALLALALQPEACERVLAEWPHTRARLQAVTRPTEGATGEPSIRDSVASVD